MKRRSYIKNMGASSLAFTVVPDFVVSGLGHTDPSDMVNISVIGIGNMGKFNLNNMVGQILCDEQKQTTIGSDAEDSQENKSRQTRRIFVLPYAPAE